MAEEDYATWARLAIDALEGFDALYIHIKGPDVPAHDGRAEDKRDVIELIDRAFFGELLPGIDPGRTIVAVTADHATSCLRKAHTAEPVLLVTGGPVRPDGTEAFGERACASRLGALKGIEIPPAGRRTAAELTPRLDVRTAHRKIPQPRDFQAAYSCNSGALPGHGTEG